MLVGMQHALMALGARALIALGSIAYAGNALATQSGSSAHSPLRVLVYTVSAGFVHDVVKRESPDKPSIVEQALTELGRDTGDFEVVLSRDAADFTPENLKRFGLVFFYTTGDLPFTKAERDALFDFVKRGGAFAGAHCATDTFYQLPEYGEMIGAYFDGHPWHEKVKVRVEDRDHPATKHLGESFEITDEIYQFKAPYDRSKLHVLLSLDPSALDLKKDGIHRADRDFAIAWCKEFGQGRVFYTALGHQPEVWKDARFLKLIDGGFRWAMRTAEDEKPPPKRVGEPKPVEPEKKSGAKLGDDPKAPDAAARAQPIVPDGFAIDLVLEAPDILWPSVVHALPDGSILVGEDPMDMPGPTDQPLDRILHIAFKPDGTIEKKVFADRLYAVFGLEEIDGDVYVMNMPHLTRLRDTDGDGVADERTEILTDLGPRAPGQPGGFNDHIVSGIRLGMDGFLYITVGDKGIPLAHGSDGSTLTLRGGGVIRVRPDGSRLELVASGLRNILDVAIDDHGEMFTYDNTDDGLGWWTRFSHIVPGGYYGYPWDYHEHKDRMLACIQDYGGGSPTGGLVYREAAWPHPYSGSVFFCEWGKGTLRRFEVAPDHTTFRVSKDEDFVRAGGVKSFRPLNVRESPDGRFLYMTDWGYDGWTQPEKAGRLWRIRRADDDPARPSVARELPGTIDGLIDALGDPSFNHRLRSQRALVRRGAEAVSALRALCTNDAGSPRAREHAVWALAEIDADAAAATFAIALSLKPIDVRVQIARVVGQRPSQYPKLLLTALGDPNPRIKREVLSALVVAREIPPEVARAVEGLYRSGNPQLGTAAGVSDPLLHFLFVRALRKTGFVPDVLADADRERALEILRGRFEPACVDALRKVAEDEGLAVSKRVPAIRGLAEVYKKPPAWDGKWWNTQPAKSAPPAGTLEWEGTAVVAQVLRAQLGDRVADVRRAALEAIRDAGVTEALPEVRARYAVEPIQNNRRIALDVLAALHDPDAGDLLAGIVRDPAASESLREHAIATACAIRTPAMIALLCAVAGDDAAAASQVAGCASALGRLKEKSAVPVLVRRAQHGTDEVRVAAIDALVAIEGETALPTIEPLLADPSVAVRRAAIQAYGDLRVAAAQLLVPHVADDATREVAISALARVPDPRAFGAYLVGLKSATASVRDASRSALGAVRESVRADIETLVARRELDGPTLATLRSIYSDPQPVVAWRIIGPFKRGDAEPKVVAKGSGTSPSAFEIDANHPDFASDMQGLDGARVAWTQHTAEPHDGFVDLVKVVGNLGNVAAFAAGEIVSTRDREAEMRAGSDDTIRVWVNGELADDFPGNRAWTADEDRFRVKLKAGANAVLVCVGNTTGQWSFNVKVAGEASGPIFESDGSASGIEEYRKFALEHSGDPARGFKLVREHAGLMCMRCHTINGTGAQVGPDLSDVAAKYSKEDIIASVLEPSKRIADGYKSATFELKDGTMLSGLVKSETDSELSVYDVNGELKRLDKSEIASRRASDVSLMPEGQATLLSKEEFADLIGYLTTLRGSALTVPK
jgi:putative membrane-bound dehydrogenase-like protein